MGVDPWNYTLQELVWMAKGRRMSEWDQTSTLWAAIVNTVRDAKKNPKPWSPCLVHPLREDKDYAKPLTDGFAELRHLFEKD